MKFRILRIHCVVLAAACTLLSLAGCTQERADAPQQLTVFAATSLTNAMDAVAEAFQQANPGVEVIRHYASSSQLAAQLIQGAPADVFASANEIQMANVVSRGLVQGEPTIFTHNHLTIIVPADNPAGLLSPEDLASQGIRLVLAAPDVPIRVYSDRLIEMLGDEEFRSAVYANLVSEETNVRQVVAKIALGEADAGIVYTSDVTSDVAQWVIQIKVPADINLTAEYPMALLSGSKNTSLGEAFIDFVLGPEGQAILAEWGFGIPQIGD